MYVGVEPAGGEDLALTGDGFGAGADDDVHARLNIRVAGLADGGDAAVLKAHVGFDDAPMVDDQHVGDDRIDRAASAADLRLAHAVADDLAAAELHFFTVGGEILLHFDNQAGVRQAHFVAGGGAEHIGIGGARDFDRH